MLKLYLIGIVCALPGIGYILYKQYKDAGFITLGDIAACLFLGLLSWITVIAGTLLSLITIISYLDDIVIFEKEKEKEQ